MTGEQSQCLNQSLRPSQTAITNKAWVKRKTSNSVSHDVIVF